jgi:hypothetical protein
LVGIDYRRMRLVSLLITLFTAYALAGAALSPLPGLNAIPDGSEVRILRDELQSVLASGTVRNRVLTMTTSSSRLPAGERVRIWISVPIGTANDLKSFVGNVNADGSDVLLESGKDRVSFVQVLRDAYSIRLEMKQK